MNGDPTLDDLIEELIGQASIGGEMDNRPRIAEAKAKLVEYINGKYTEIYHGG